MLISLIPVSARQDLKFASFSTLSNNNFNLVGMEAAGAGFAGWHRLLVSQMGGPLSPISDKYVSKVRQGLQLGSLAEFYDAHRPHSTDQVTEVAPVGEAFVKPGSKSDLSPLVKSSAPLAARSKPDVKKLSVMTAIPPVRKRRVRLSRLTRQPVRMGGGSGVNFKPLLTALVVLLGLGAAGWGYFMGVPDQIRFFRTGGENMQAARQATSLLEVVNVGEIYTAQLKKVKRADFVLGLDQNLVRLQAQATLQAEAAGPLLKQADLFLKLANEGIQQGLRPDRETSRMKILSEQRQILHSELYRLELAWHSLDKGVGWVDLGTLGDDQLKARRDSLAKVQSAALAESQAALGTFDYWQSLQLAARHVDGMYALLRLFQQETWSAQWEKELFRAAEQVSPTASPVTRAYRNSAFSLIRLKRAERMDGSLGLPYVLNLAEAGRPAPEVHDVLPSLRRQARKFADGEAPALLVGLLTMYQVIGDHNLFAQAPATSLDRLKHLQENYAFKFDPQVYEPILERLKFEVLHTTLTAGADSASLPDASFGAADRTAALAFHTALGQDPVCVDWDSLGRRNEGTFLGRWSSRLASSQGELMVASAEAGDVSWQDCRLLLRDLRERVASGVDWTSVWVDLSQELTLAASLHGGWSTLDPVRQGRSGQLQELKLLLEEARPLQLETVTIRLAPEALTSPGEVQLEFQSENGTQILYSEPITIGPAAPEGSGWVGTGFVDFQVSISPVDAFTGRVRAVTGQEVLLEVHYPSLADRVGPGGVSRPRSAAGGSLQFRTEGSWWGSLQLMNLVDGVGTI